MTPKIKIVVRRRGSDWFRLSAQIAGRQVGFLAADTTGDPIMRIHRIFVKPEHRRSGIATRLYEAAAKISCEKYARPLASDRTRSLEAEAFWKKQVAKGKAQPLTKSSGYVLSCPAPTSLSRPVVHTRVR